jgi:endonuclease YncB( thermonuclease family)
MKEIQKLQSLKYGLRPGEFAAAVGSVKLANEMVNAGWIKPVVKRHKLVLFDAGEVARCWARILNGEAPLS